MPESDEECGGEIRAEPASILAGLSVPNVHWSHMLSHVRNCIDGVRSRKLTVSHPEAAHRAHTIAHLTNLALRLGRTLRGDPAAERFIDDAEADRMLRRAMRPPWQI